jgi:RNA polymerase sigma factor
MDNFDNKIKTDDNKREEFIKENLVFVRRAAMRVCKRPLFWENDDELSIALMAFNEAIDNYENDKGKFSSFANLIIKRRLIDYFRKESRHPIISIDDTEDLEVDTHPYETESSMKEYSLEQEKLDRIRSIKLFDKVLKKYSLSFQILVKNSPKHTDTRQELIIESFKLVETKETKNLVDEMLKKGKVSPTKVSKATNLSRKQIKTWQKYILALIIVFSHEELSSIRDFLGYSLGGDDK